MQPTLLLGLDGATFTVLDRMMAAGHMPFLQQFQAEGVRAGLLSTPHPLTPPAWTTLMTGRSPGNHGIYDFLRSELRGNRAFFTLNNFRDIQCETLWTLVSRLGGRVLGLNFPLTAPPPAVAGAIVPGLLSWRHLRRNVYPPELYEEIKALPGFNPRELSFDFEELTSTPRMTDEELVAWVRSHVLERDQQWYQILQRLEREGPFDLTAIVFDGVDKLQHVCWRFLDPVHLPARLTAVQQTLAEMCVQYFRELDRRVADTVGRAGPGVNVFLASDHGFGPSVRIFCVNKWLEREGLLRWPPSPVGTARNSHFVHLDWEHTTAFTQSGATNGIHIRVRQQPGEPGVPPEEYDAFRDRLVAQLAAIRDPETGQPFFQAILRREEAFPGVHQDQAPDLTLVPFDHGFVSVLNQEPIIQTRAAVTGTHYPVGILLARGPAVAVGRTLPLQTILDVAPTMLYSLGLPIPSDFEGRVIESVFDAAHWHAHPVKTGPATEPPCPYSAPRTDPDTAAAEEQGVLNQLRALGYVE